MSKTAYREWEEEQGISPVSPEAYYAEKAWNAALEAAKIEMSAHRGMEWESGVLDTFRTDK